MTQSLNCVAENLNASVGKVSFDYQADSLPYPCSAYRAVSHLIPFESEFNQERLVVRGLKKGTYTLKMDGIPLGGFTADELADGINLARLEQAPQVVQANEVFRLCEERAELANTLRGVLFGCKYLKRKGYDPDDTAACKAVIEKMISQEKAVYQKRALEEYAQWVDRYEGQVQVLESMATALYSAAQPKAHRVELSSAE